MQHRVLPCVFILVVFFAGSACGECTERDKQALRETGASQYAIDQLCGVAEEDQNIELKPEVMGEKKAEAKGSKTHGRLQELTNICQTDLLWCTLEQEGPPGTPCICQSSYGPQKGMLVPR
jgi:hypothetical protein